MKTQELFDAAIAYHQVKATIRKRDDYMVRAGQRCLKYLVTSCGSDCWVWTGSSTDSGPHLNLGGEFIASKVKVRRLMWALFIGPLPGGMFPGQTAKDAISVKCGNLRCIRPSHLQQCSHSRKTKGHVRSALPAPKRPASDCLWHRAKQIIHRKKEGLTVKQLALEFKVSTATVERALWDKKRWLKYRKKDIQPIVVSQSIGGCLMRHY